MKTRLVTTLLLAVTLGLVVLGGLLPALSVAAPAAAPTPIGSVVASDSGNFYELMTARAVITDGYYEAPASLAGFEWADWQYVIDQTDVNTVTLTLEYSNDGENWVTGPNLVASNAADAGDLVRLPLFGRYSRIYANVTTTDTVTVTVNLLAK